MAKVRTFVAVEASVDVRRGAAEVVAELRRVGADVKWAPVEQLHWTLNFLGDVLDRELDDVCRAVTKGVAASEPFELSAWGVGAFPHGDRPRTIWLGSDRGVAEVAALARAIELALKPLGFKPEARPFQPHLTLGRVRGPHRIQELGQALAPLANYSAGVTTVDEVTIFASELEPTGPVYTPLAHAVLGEEGGRKSGGRE